MVTKAKGEYDWLLRSQGGDCDDGEWVNTTGVCDLRAPTSTTASG
jgi:hypothetical protein